MDRCLSSETSINRLFMLLCVCVCERERETQRDTLVKNSCTFVTSC